MQNGYKMYVIDTETTGLSAVDNDVIEIAMCRLTMENKKIEQEHKSWLLKAMNPKTIQDEALKINGHQREDILHQTAFGRENYLLPEVVIPEIEMWMMEDGVSALDRIFVGQNPFFDVNALTELWKRQNSIETFPFSLENNNRIIDTKQIVAMYDVCMGKRRRYYNLSSLVKAFSIKKGKAHRASEDTRMTCDLLIKLLEPIVDVVTSNFNDCFPDDEEQTSQAS